MACLIDPAGLFNGDRLAKLSLMARLHWPYFFAAANGYGRIEINYLRLTAKIFSRFPSVPSEKDVVGWLKEYRDNNLLFIYRANGAFWGQFDTPQKYLPRYKDRASSESPAPGPGFQEWKQRYLDGKSGAATINTIACSVFEDAPEVLQRDFQNISETFPHAVAVAVAEEKPSSSPTGNLNQAIDHVAQRIHARHPLGRRCGLGEVKKKLKGIVAKLPADSPVAKLEFIDRNHEAWCASEAWTKNDGEYAKGLDNWLAPANGRFEIPPPSATLTEPENPKLLMM